MKAVFCLFVLISVVYCIPVIQETPKETKDYVVKLSPVEVSEDHAGEEGVDLKPAEQFFIGYQPYGFGYGGYGGYGYRRRGWGGYGSFSRSSFSASDFFG